LKIASDLEPEACGEKAVIIVLAAPVP